MSDLLRVNATEAALFSNLLKLPEDTDPGKAVNDALPKSFTVFD